MFYHQFCLTMIESLEASDLGCHFYSVYVGCLLYADDIILLSASVVNLQKMLDIILMDVYLISYAMPRSLHCFWLVRVNRCLLTA